MSTKIERLELANANLVRELREKESETKRLSVRSTLDKDFKRVQTLEQKLRDAHRNLEDLEGELVAQKDKFSKVQYEVDILRSVVQLRDHPELLRVADAEVRCRKMEQELRHAKEELVSSGEKCRVYYEGCTKAAKEADSLRYKCSQLQDELERQSQDMKELLVEREGFVREVNDATEETSDLQQQLDAQQKANAQLKEDLRAREQRIRSVEQEVADLQVDEEHARRTWCEGHKLFVTTAQNLKECQAERDQLRVKFQLGQEEEQTNLRRMESMQRTMESLRAENKQMRDQLAVWQTRADEIDAMGRRLALTDADHDKKQQRIASLEESAARLSQRLSDKEKECNSIAHELDAAKEDIAVQTEQMNVLSRNLMTRIEKMEQERDAAVEERDVLEKELRTAVDKVSTLTVLMTHHQSLNRSTLHAASSGSIASGSEASGRLQRILSSSHQQQQGMPSEQQQQQQQQQGMPTKSNLSNERSIRQVPSSPPRQQTSGINLSDIALSPPTPLPAADRGLGSSSSSQALRSRLERLTR